MFRAPASVIRLLESIRCNFFWGGSGVWRKLTWVRWEKKLLPYGSSGLDIGLLNAKNLALLGKWWWRFKSSQNSLWSKVITSVYGSDRGLGSSNISLSPGCSSTWAHIIKAGSKIDDMGISFISSFSKELGDDSTINFWTDIWVGTTTLREKFGRLYALDMDKPATLENRVLIAGNAITFNWEWARDLRGRALEEFVALSSSISGIQLRSDSTDRMKWSLNSDGVFTAKKLKSLIEEKSIHGGNNVIGTIMNRVVPQKISIFVWRAKQKRIPVRFELDKRGMDLDSVLCPFCGGGIENVDHILSNFRLTSEVWKGFLRWWSILADNITVLDPLLSDPIFNSATIVGKSIWEAVKWVCCYTIWKGRNNKVFKGKEWNSTNIVSEIQSTSYGWISSRVKKLNIEWHQWMQNPRYYVLSNIIGVG
ncbi:uncharacterized protein [Rutidosis leptorrhynchoides]|uniref:uncharacterized protein n=1 Tax=Rutidosis leptorrhynchoides TaxID=125765 RepID=UPI003A99B195